MIRKSQQGFLLAAPALLWLSGCTTVPSPYGGAPVVDRSIQRPSATATPAPLPTAPLPPVPQSQVKPLPRPEPLRPQQFPPGQPLPDTPYATPSPALPPMATRPEPVPPAANTPSPGSVPPVSSIPPAGPPRTTPPERVSPPSPAPITPPPAEISRQGNQAVVALLESASQAVKAGKLDMAAAYLERALRVEPRNAGIWYDLAQVRLHQHKYEQAESLATKSNSVAGGNNSMRARNWRLIAVARRAQGNSAGADEADAQAVVTER